MAQHVKTRDGKKVPDHIQSDGLGRGCVGMGCGGRGSKLKLLLLINAEQSFGWTDVPEQHSRGLSPARSQ